MGHVHPSVLPLRLLRYWELSRVGHLGAFPSLGCLVGFLGAFLPHVAAQSRPPGGPSSQLLPNIGLLPSGQSSLLFVPVSGVLPHHYRQAMECQAMAVPYRSLVRQVLCPSGSLYHVDRAVHSLLHPRGPSLHGPHRKAAGGGALPYTCLFLESTSTSRLPPGCGGVPRLSSIHTLDLAVVVSCLPTAVRLPSLAPGKAHLDPLRMVWPILVLIGPNHRFVRPVLWPHTMGLLPAYGLQVGSLTAAHPPGVHGGYVVVVHHYQVGACPARAARIRTMHHAGSSGAASPPHSSRWWAGASGSTLHRRHMEACSSVGFAAGIRLHRRHHRMACPPSWSS